MIGKVPESSVAKPKVEDHLKKNRESFTADASTIARLKALKARTGLGLATIVEKCVLRSLPAFEKDPGEILREDSTDRSKEE